MTSPMAIPIAAPIAKPAASRFRLPATSVRKSRVGQISHACSSTSEAGGTRNDSAAPAQSSQTTNSAGEHGEPEQRPPRSAERSPHGHRTRSSPLQWTTRRSRHSERDVDRVAEKSGEQDGGVHLRQLERELLPLHVRPIPSVAEDELGGHRDEEARSTRSP